MVVVWWSDASSVVCTSIVASHTNIRLVRIKIGWRESFLPCLPLDLSYCRDLIGGEDILEEAWKEG
jgi:hypothetical protein